MNPLAAILAVVAAGLAGVVGFELLEPASEPVPVPVPAAAGVAAPVAPVPVPGGAVVNNEALLARPLFSQTRRPPNVAGPQAAAMAGTAPLPRLTAILIDGPSRRAIFAGGENAKAITVVEGGQVGAFTVRTIEPRQVTLVGPDGARTVRTTFDPSLQAAAPMPATGFIPPQFPGIQVPGMPGAGVQMPSLPIPLPPSTPYSQPATPVFGAGNGTSPGAAR